MCCVSGFSLYFSPNERESVYQEARTPQDKSKEAIPDKIKIPYFRSIE